MGSLDHLALYVPHIDTKPAGLGVYVDAICGRLSRQIPRITLFTETPEHVPSMWGVESVIRIPSARLRGAPRLAARQAWLQTAFPFELRRRGADALFVPFHDGTLFSPCPQVIVIHDITPLTLPSNYFNPLLVAHMRHVLPRLIERSSVITVSEHTKLDLRRTLNVSTDRVTVVGEGYDKTLFRAPTEDHVVDDATKRHGLGRPYLLYAGTYAAHKNVGLLVDVLAGLAESGHNLDLALCGRPDAGEFPKVLERFHALGLESRVRLLGYVERSDLPLLMSGAAAFLYPSLYEGFGLAPLEAMASGAVVVATSAASVPEVVGDGGVLLPPGDAGPWIKTLSHLLSSPESSQRLRRAARRRALTFCWDDAAERTQRVLEQALESKR